MTSVFLPAVTSPPTSAAIDHLNWPLTSNQHIWTETLGLNQDPDSHRTRTHSVSAQLGDTHYTFRKNQSEDPLVPSYLTHRPIRWSWFRGKHEGLHQSHKDTGLRLQRLDGRQERQKCAIWLDELPDKYPVSRTVLSCCYYMVQIRQ